MAKLFDVYDKRNEKIIVENKSIKEISAILGVAECTIRNSIENGFPVGKRYTFIYKADKDEYYKWSVLQSEEWDRVRMLFANVEWVKEEGPGVKVLSISKDR